MSGAPGTRTGPIWQKRFYDFNVARSEKRIEKLRYMHRNPVKRGLVTAPEEWSWSSFRSYAFHEEGPVRINCQEWPLKVTYSHEKAQSFTLVREPVCPRKDRVIEKQPSLLSTHSSENRG